ncbi:MAG TPA: hypothetical protein VFO65_03605 [Acidimicrobiales bacterium]|nr:hypothetical protein [Acidimicrobiales bacterium]
MRRARYAAAVVVLVIAATYVFVYLYRWEWHRALVAGVLFLAAEVGLAAGAVLDRLRSLQERLDQLEDRAGYRAPEALDRVRETAPEPRTSFDWLTTRDGNLSVFVPVLLGAGVVLSGAAWLLERIARATAGPVLERTLALRLERFALPVGVLQGVPGPVSRRRPLWPHVVVVAVVAAAATVGIDALADATQNRADIRRPGTTGVVVVAVSSRDAGTTLEATEMLWGACRVQLGRRYQLTGIRELGAGLVEVRVRPAVGKYAERRLRGCIADGTVDKISGRVERVEAGPARP